MNWDSRLDGLKSVFKIFGIPQNRNRVFLVGIKSDSPNEEFFEGEFKEILSVQNTMADLNLLLKTRHKRRR